MVWCGRRMNSVSHNARRSPGVSPHLIGILSSLTIFSGNIYIAVLAMLRLESIAGVSSRVFLGSLFALNCIVTLLTLRSGKSCDWRRAALAACFVFMLALSMVTTSLIQGSPNSTLNSEFQAFLIVSACCLLSVINLFSVGDSGFEGLLKSVPVIAIIYTLGSAVALLFSSGLTTGGFMSDMSGLNYQSNSYCAAYAIGLTLFYLSHFFEIPKMKVFRIAFFSRPFWLVLLVVQSSVLISSGGRGGFLTAVVLLGYFIFENRAIVLKNVRIIAGGIVALTIVLMMSTYVAGSLHLEYVGFERILSFLERGSDAGRSALAAQAVAFGLERPLFGHGAGSVFYLMGAYSHNCFLDIFVEFGCFGLALTIFLLFTSWSNIRKMYRRSRLYSLITYVFIMGGVLSLFSGYYLVNAPVFFAMMFAMITGANGNTTREHGLS